MKFQQRTSRLILTIILFIAVASLETATFDVRAQTAQPTADATMPTPLKQQLMLKTGKVEIALVDGTKVTIDTTTKSPKVSSLPAKAPVGTAPTDIGLPAKAPITIALDPSSGLPVADIVVGETINTNIPGGGLAKLEVVIPATNNKTATMVVTINPGTVFIEQQADTNPTPNPNQTTCQTNWVIFVLIGDVIMDVPSTGLLSNNIALITLLGNSKVDAQNGSKLETRVEMPATGISVSNVVDSGSVTVKSINGSVTTVAPVSGGQSVGSQLVANPSSTDITQLQTGGVNSLLAVLKNSVTTSALTSDQITSIQKARTTPTVTPVIIVTPVIPLLEILNQLLGNMVTNTNITPDQQKLIQDVVADLVGICQCTAPVASGVGGVSCS